MSNILGRLTTKKLIAWVNEEFKKKNINDYIATSITPTRYNRDQYEGGACRLMVRYEPINKSSINDYDFFLCFYRISDYQYALSKGYEIYLKKDRNNRFELIKDFEIELRKIK